MNNTWPLAAGFVRKWEGGYVDDPADPGGVTKYGVSLRWLRAIGLDVDHDGDVDADDVRALTPELALDLFRQRFWNGLYLDEVPGLPAVAIFDAAVNCGMVRSVRLAQQCCNFYPGLHLIEDGTFGPVTRARIESIVLDNPQAERAFAARLLSAREQFYRNLVQRKPELAKFLNGWINRVNALRVALGVSE